jgi:hypothetical protein
LFKKSRLTSFVLPIIGMLLFVVLFGTILFWETYGREKFLYKDIVVLKHDIRRGVVINENMLTTEKIEATKINKETIIDINEVKGKVTRHFIPSTSPLHPLYFEDTSILTEKGTKIVKIPNEWVASVPDSLRRYDKISIYAVKDIQNKEIQYNLNGTQNIENKQVNYNLSGTISTHKAGEINASMLPGNIILNTVAAYVKDTNNREVTSTDNDRLNGTGKIGSVEIYLKPEQLKILEDSFEIGNKFIILYSEEE